MFRTRDFILIFTTIVFLVVAISATVLSESRATPATTESVVLAEVEDVQYEAEIYSPETISREERLARMREKIAESGDLMIREPESNETAEDTQEETENAADMDTASTVQLCANHRPAVIDWPIGGAQLEVVEGARVVYREIVPAPQLGSSMATNSAPLPLETSREVLLELPIRTVSNGTENCLTTDVVGVAQDGSLIRFSEIGLYSVFGESTVIGYALDGFPIHGVTDRPLDTCGGAVVRGQYGYFLSDEREAVIHCFSAAPVAF